MKTYAIKEVFDTVQGEGGRAGARSVFVRFAGCNAWNGRPEDRKQGKGECARWCDTDFFKGTAMTAEALAARMDELWPPHRDYARWCVLTGGEPALQLDEELLATLDRAGWGVAVETNGSVQNEALLRVDWLTVSPKLGLGVVCLDVQTARLIKPTLEVELKVVLPGTTVEGAGWTDRLLAELEIAVQPDHCFVQPQDPTDPLAVEVSHLHGNLPGTRALTKVWGREQYEANVRRCLEFVRAHPHWRISLQQHKLLGVR